MCEVSPRRCLRRNIAARRRPQGCDRRSCRQQLVEMAGILQRIKLSAATDMVIVDEDLRHAVAAARPAAHAGANLRTHRYVNLLIGDVLAFEQPDRPCAVAAHDGGVDFDFWHWPVPFWSCQAYIRSSRRKSKARAVAPRGPPQAPRPGRFPPPTGILSP
uniref:Uncharacterized protein n=1 Tax=uncultured alpha proteobacterium HF0070_17D04 TaxID=710805 RepID=E0XS80_9PROT|nr:hypothetical protein [uncultured alpha proteobacterium HF0070_17D04]